MTMTLKQWMKENNRTYVWLAHATNTRKETIYNWVAGRNVPTPTMIKKIQEITNNQVCLTPKKRTYNPKTGRPTKERPTHTICNIDVDDIVPNYTLNIYEKKQRKKTA